MATGTLGTSARDYHTRQTSFLSWAINNANFPAAATIKIGTIPMGGVALRAGFGTTVVFNNVTLNQLSIGKTASGAELVASTVGLAALGRTDLAVPIAAASGPFAADQDVYVTNTSTGGGQTTGAGVVWVEYMVPNPTS